MGRSMWQHHMSANNQMQVKSDLNAAVTLDKASQFQLSLNLEWLKGCQFSCNGCHVNKEGASPYNKQDISNLLEWLSSMRFDGNYRPTIVFIGPTDFMTADNTIKILNSPAAYNVLSQFKRLSLQTTYLNISRIEDIARVLKSRYSHMELEINFVIEPEHLENEKYLSRIKENQRKVYEVLDWQKPLMSFCILNVYEYDRIKKNNIKKLLNDYQQLHEKIKAYFGCTIDFNFSMLRNSWWSNEDVAEAVRSVSRIFDGGVNHEFAQTVRFSFGKLTDSLIEKHYNWHAGDLYVSPMLYERIASFHPSLKVPMVSYTVKETEAFEDHLLIKQYDGSGDKECSDCRYKASCIDRGILTFMDMHDIKKCIIAREALDAINKLD